MIHKSCGIKCEAQVIKLKENWKVYVPIIGVSQLRGTIVGEKRSFPLPSLSSTSDLESNFRHSKDETLSMVWSLVFALRLCEKIRRVIWFWVLGLGWIVRARKKAFLTCYYIGGLALININQYYFFPFSLDWIINYH